MKAAPCCCARPTRSVRLRSNSSKFGARATGVDVIRQQQGSDPSSVVYTAVDAARARKVDYVIVDTAGRLHTKDNLMAELEKMQRTVKKLIPDAPHEVLARARRHDGAKRPGTGSPIHGDQRRHRASY